MATVYSGYSAGWKPSGSSIYKKYRARLDYSVSAETDTTITYKAVLYVNINSSVNASYSGTLNLSGTTYSGSCETVFGETNTVTCVSAKTKTFTKGETATTATLKGGVKSSSGSWTGATVTATATVTIPAKRYEITFDANGGSNPPASQKKIHGTALTLTTGVPTRDGYDFVSWNTAADGSGTSYASGATFSTNAITTLYAQWHLSYVPPKVENIRAYRVANGKSGYNPDVLSTGTKTYAEFKLTNPVSGTVTVSAKFGTTASSSSGTSGSIKYFYSPDSHLSATSSETVTFTLSVTDYKGNTYTYTYSTFISTENYIFDAFKGTSGSTEYQSFAIGGISRDFSNSNRHSKGDFDCYMHPTFYTMAGEIKMWAGDTIPDGWLLCDGSEVSKTTYPNLYAAIGDLWGVPNSSSNFKLPNLVGRVPAGYNPDDTDTTETFGQVGAMGGARGAWYHTHTMSSSGAHGHTNKYMADISGTQGTRDLPYSGGDKTQTSMIVSSGAHTHPINSSGSSDNKIAADKANMPPYAVVKYIICAI